MASTKANAITAEEGSGNHQYFTRPRAKSAQTDGERSLLSPATGILLTIAPSLTSDDLES